jgi:alpha-N-arabinofuranosidase
MYYFDYSLDGNAFVTLDKVDCALLSTEVVGGFTGMTIGMYATLNRSYTGNGKTYADFDYFDYVER